MRRYVDGSGRAQLWLDEAEVESMMSVALQAAGMFPTPDAPAVDLERLLELGMEVSLDQHAPLDRDVLGITTFMRGRRPVVEINADLTGAFDASNATDTDRARWRSTLAHEGAHVVLHAQLFQLDDSQGQMFSEEGMGPTELQRCLKRAVGFDVAGTDPREVQANMGMAALLMPHPVFTPLARETAEQLGLRPGGLSPTASGTRRLVTALANRFEVSRQATEIRLQGLGFFAARGERSLGGC
jgi:hypothetical protein